VTEETTPRDGQRVVVVTGGGGGIGAAIAEELGRQGAFVVTMDPLVSLDGTERLPAPEETTAGRIVAAGGSARATSVSVTERDAVRDLFEELGRVDAVINVAGISRPTSFTRGSEDDWRDVLEVHLGGYVNVLRAALPMMAAAGRGRILGVTSGSGWRAADAGAYSCAKRAVAALTWQLGASTPGGVTVNAISPIAVTRMVTAALQRSTGAGAPGAATGGLSLGSMPGPEELGPLGAHLVREEMAWCRGQVVFAGGSEVALIQAPRLLEVVRTGDVRSLATVLDAVGPGALATAEAQQASNGAGNPRFTDVFEASPGERLPAGASSCLLASDRPELADPVERALADRGVTVHRVPAARGARDAAGALASGIEHLGSVDAVVVATRSRRPARTSGWEQVLDDHDGVVDEVIADAGWARAVADHASSSTAAVRLVTLADATSSAGRSRAQASAQLSRASRRATDERVAAFAVSVESASAGDLTAAGELAAHLACHPSAPDLSGAELAVGAGWLGLRSHPRPGPSITLGRAEVPAWFDDVLHEALGVGRDAR
jgi:NAD(P)-dependent dehydrogenase (short-subunit alcohol dehydrogenase family)